MLEEDWKNKVSFNYITKCEIFFCILAVNPNGSSMKFVRRNRDTICGSVKAKGKSYSRPLPFIRLSKSNTTYSSSSPINGKIPSINELLFMGKTFISCNYCIPLTKESKPTLVNLLLKPNPLSPYCLPI